MAKKYVQYNVWRGEIVSLCNGPSVFYVRPSNVYRVYHSDYTGINHGTDRTVSLQYMSVASDAGR